MNTPMNFDQLVTLCRRTHEELRLRAARAVDAHLVVRNRLFGHYIAEFEQRGADRAEYGARLLVSLANHLKPLKINGSSVTRLKLYRSFYRIFPIGPTLSAELLNLFPLGWSHYVELLTIESPEERRFYEIEAAANQWSVRELQRQIASSLYERLALSRDKEEIRRLLAPTVRPIPAQGNALGSHRAPIQALKGRPKTACRDIAPAREFLFPSSFIGPAELAESPQPSSLP